MSEQVPQEWIEVATQAVVDAEADGHVFNIRRQVEAVLAAAAPLIRQATADEIAAEIELRRDATVLKDPIADLADKAAFNICARIARRVGGGGGGGGQ